MIEMAMIETVVKVVDRFTDLLKYRQHKRREFFQNVLEPLFNDLMVMHTDYIKMFDDCRSQLLDGDVPIQNVAESLRQRRIVYESLRIKSDAILKALKESDLSEEVKKFLTAAAYHIPDGRLGPVQSTPASMILNALYSPSKQLVDHPQRKGDSPVGDRRLVLDLVTSTADDIRRRWGWICEEYVRAKMWSLK